MPVWEVLRSQVLVSNPVLRLHLETIRTSKGEETDWTVVEIGDGAAVVPIHEDGSITLIRQYRHALRRDMWEFPAGRVEVDETAAEAAIRELQEEVGLSAAVIEEHGQVVPLDGICRHVIKVFVARGLEAVATAHETFESIEVQRLSPKELSALVRSGELDCGITLSIIAKLGLLEQVT